MKPPEHHFVNEYGQREVRRMWLGSEVEDDNGREIFEGDLLADRDGELSEVVFVDGKFMASPFSHHGWIPLGDIADGLEVVGHIAEDES